MSKFSFHLVKGAWSLVINMAYTSYLTILPNDLRLLRFHKWKPSAQSSSQTEILVNISKKELEKEIELFP